MTQQTDKWSSEFGREYTDRNPQTSEEMDRLYLDLIGVTRTSLNEEFVGSLDRSLRILEVGSNVGSQLALLQKMGFKNLYGIELQSYAVELAKSKTSGINLIQGSAFDIPFKSGFFDLVFTSGVLIHISPADLPRALAEIHRSTGRWIWGYEYFASTFTEIPYRGNSGMMWKGDYAGLYRKQFSDLKLGKEKKLPYVKTDSVDTMFLLEKIKS
jgi:pseudaminic acid biosynthesis-associated methylase